MGVSTKLIHNMHCNSNIQYVQIQRRKMQQWLKCRQRTLLYIMYVWLGMEMID